LIFQLLSLGSIPASIFFACLLLPLSTWLSSTCVSVATPPTALHTTVVIKTTPKKQEERQQASASVSLDSEETYTAIHFSSLAKTSSRDICKKPESTTEKKTYKEALSRSSIPNLQIQQMLGQKV
jgi:hypothetical protein